MFDFVRKMFGGSKPPAPVVEGASPEESIEALHEEFCRTFCHRPGENFMEFLKANSVTRMIEWLRPATPCAIPKGFVRLAVNTTRKGENFWDLTGISMLYEGNWNQGGVPAQESQDAVSVLAQILGKPIKVFYGIKAGGELMVLKFEP